jgi:hypothetical protein
MNDLAVIMQHELLNMTQTHDTPAPSPFHPNRPPTPTIRASTFDERHNRPSYHFTNHFNMRHGRTMGQLLSREWMIEEVDETPDASLAEIEAANREYEQRQRKYKQRRSMYYDRYADPVGDFTGYHTMSAVDTGRRRYWMSTRPTTFATVDVRETMAR